MMYRRAEAPKAIAAVASAAVIAITGIAEQQAAKAHKFLPKFHA
jgi:hypothetical protein